jgi:benzoyl-CoA reductase/2-hydroxyglutaryl-CoA dehydratase subunit BcrC/BadD/HgdB
LSPDDIVAWYGRVAGTNLVAHPRFTHNWLMMGYELMAKKTQINADKRYLPSGNEGYALFMDQIVKGQAHPNRSVITSIFTPNEIFHSMDVLPLTAEAVAAFVSGAQAEHWTINAAEGMGIPETYCSYHKTLLGLSLSGVADPPRMLAATSVACDANNLTFKTLADKWRIPFYYVEVPFEVSRDSIEYVADELRGMRDMAEDAFHAKLYEQKLKESCALSKQTQETLLKALRHRAGHNLHNEMTVDQMEMLNFHLLLGTKGALHLAQTMDRDFAQAEPYHGLNLVWVHVQPFFLSVLGEQINFSQRAQIIASDMMYDCLPPTGAEAKLPGAHENGWLFDPGKPYEFMAERVVRNCFNGSSERRADTVVRLAKATHADGVVVFTHWGCRQTEGASGIIQARAEEAGFPTLILAGDGCDRANCMAGQMKTRFDAFLEQLEAKRVNH